MIILIVFGVWLLVDAIISIIIYPKQSWLKDHSIRIIRGIIAISIIFIGATIK